MSTTRSSNATPSAAPRVMGLAGVVLLVAASVLRFTGPASTYDRVSTATILAFGLLLGVSFVRPEAPGARARWSEAVICLTMAMVTLTQGTEAHWPDGLWHKVFTGISLPLAVTMLVLVWREGRRRR